MPLSLNDLALMIDHSLLHPTMTDRKLRDGCLLAREYGTASVCIKPYAVPGAVGILSGSDVAVGTVVGFPHGSSRPDVKAEETRRAVTDGATEIDMVINIGKALSDEWDYLAEEMALVREACREGGALLKVIFENDFLDEDRIARLSRIGTEAGADFIKTSTGYGFVKGGDGRYGYKGATVPHLKLMRREAGPDVQVKAAGGVRTLRDLLLVRRLGVTRVGATATKAILDEARSRLDAGEDLDDLTLPEVLGGAY